MSQIRDTHFERLFPVLTPRQVDRIATYGSRRSMRRGDVLMDPGDHHPRCAVVVRGSAAVLRVTNGAETVVQVIRAGQFSGEVNLLTGRAAFVRVRAEEDGEVVVLDRDQVLRVLQLDSEISQIVMRAFI